MPPIKKTKTIKMKKLFAIIAVAGLLTACNNDEAAKKEAAEKATADSVRAAFVADSIKAATASPMVDSLKAKMEGAVDKMGAAVDTMKAKMEGAADKMKAGADKMKEGAEKMKEAVKKTN